MHEKATAVLEALQKGDHDAAEEALHELSRMVIYRGKKINALSNALEKVLEEKEKMRRAAVVLSEDCKRLAEIRTQDHHAMQRTTNSQNAELQSAYETIITLKRENRTLQAKLALVVLEEEADADQR